MNINPPAPNAQNDDQQEQGQSEQAKAKIDYVNSYQPPAAKGTDAANSSSSSPGQEDSSDQGQSGQLGQTAPQQQNANSNVTSAPQEPEADRRLIESERLQAGVSEQTQPKSEELVDQNIFVLLGITDGDPKEKERFLNELQQVIWEDFLENDLDLLVTTSEKEEVDQILANPDWDDLKKQEEVIIYLDKLIPDLEEILTEKALELKQEMVQERVESMRQYYSNDEKIMRQVSEAAKLFAQDKWLSGSEALNRINQAA